MGTAYSFGAVSFQILVPNAGKEREAEVTEVHIPGGNTNYADVGGLKLRHVPLSLYFPAEASYASLEALVTTQATLVWTGGTNANTVLVSLRQTWLGPNGQCKADAMFIVP